MIAGSILSSCGMSFDLMEAMCINAHRTTMNSTMASKTETDAKEIAPVMDDPVISRNGREDEMGNTEEPQSCTASTNIALATTREKHA